ncbi:hypothetical protein DSN37_23535 [Salmonella enterica subsp. enterica serovar Kuessel]|nr:hypothetical protein [Salmonella enterica subsp. enterica serovar Kuessel]
MDASLEDIYQSYGGNWPITFYPYYQQGIDEKIKSPTFRAYPIRAILLAILDLGSAQNPHVLRVRSGFYALSVSKLAAPITPGGIGS